MWDSFTNTPELMNHISEAPSVLGCSPVHISKAWSSLKPRDIVPQKNRPFIHPKREPIFRIEKASKKLLLCEKKMETFQETPGVEISSLDSKKVRSIFPKNRRGGL